MRDVSPELDRMLWSVAESNDARAIEEFGQRYPALKSELGSRVQLVRTLKGARPSRDVPRLDLPVPTKTTNFGRPFALAVGAAVLVTMAFAAVLTFQSGQNKPIAASQEVVQPVGKTVTSPEVKGLTRAPNDPLPPTNDPAQSASQEAAPRSPSVMVETEGSSLKTVILEIAKQGGFEVEFAPGFEDDRIAARYFGVTAAEALADLGQNFGFTALPQEGKKLLILPAVDPSKPPTELPNTSYSAPLGPPAETAVEPPPSGSVQKK